MFIFRKPNVKDILFLSRLCVYHETYAPLTQATAETPNILTIWDESCAGRCASELASSVWAFLEQCDPTKPVNLWADNCSAQVNKNCHSWNCIRSFLQKIRSEKREGGCVSLCCVYSFFS